MSLTVPERNRAIKKLLETTYGKGCVSVTAGNGTAYHWVNVKFLTVPEPLVAVGSYGSLVAAVEKLIVGAGIYLSSYSSEMGDGSHACLSITMPRQAVRS